MAPGSGRKAHIVGSGIASLAAATYLIKDGGLLANNITVYEAATCLGGAMAISGNPQQGYVLPTGRVFEGQYRCAFELFSLVPSASDPHRSIKDEILEFNERHGYDDRVRIIDRAGQVVKSPHFGLSARNRLDLLRLALTPEHLLDGKAVSDFFSEDFFTTEFWVLWTSLMNALPQHSAIEFRRFMYRFLHIFPDLSTMKTILRTRYNQFDAIIVPISNWLKKQGVVFITGASVTDVEFRSTPSEISANWLEYHCNGSARKVEVGADDLVLVTNGSQVADLAVGSMSEPPAPNLRDDYWSLWRKLALGRPVFGNPEAFFGEARVPDTQWFTFTVTTRDTTFFDQVTKLTGSEPGRGGLLTLKDSSWLITFALFHQPEFIGQPSEVLTWWGFALYPARQGDFVDKAMTACNGREILEETLHHLGLDQHADRILASSNCIPSLLPYAGSIWMVRNHTDRPKAVPDGSTNFAFIGQFAEIPDEAAFTMEYAVRSARIAVATLLHLDRGPPPIYQPHHDIAVLERVIKALT
ncbi:MAG: oleate hydratase [Alphaproteobacteria bacterium]|nr:oleate hydratase [Alphaproteobacteria bacterium]